MPSVSAPTGREIVRLGRSLARLRSARQLVGRDDYLANLMLEDALEELNGVLAERTPRRTRAKV